MEASFLKSAARPEDSPRPELPSIAFAGRSNVGKSSLINSLVGRKKLAKTSNSPGRTRLINFFLVGSRWVFVDLPGFGYAKVSRQERSRWRPLVEGYLKGDRNLKCLLLLVDSRHEPSRLDQMMRQWLEEYRIPHAVVATKADKLSSNQIRKSIKRIQEILKVNIVIPYSAVTGRGRKELWRLIEED